MTCRLRFLFFRAPENSPRPRISQRCSSLSRDNTDCTLRSRLLRPCDYKLSQCDLAAIAEECTEPLLLVALRIVALESPRGLIFLKVALGNVRQVVTPFAGRPRLEPIKRVLVLPLCLLVLAAFLGGEYFNRAVKRDRLSSFRLFANRAGVCVCHACSCTLLRLCHERVFAETL